MKRNTQKLMLIVLCTLSFAACKKEQLTPDETIASKSNGNASLIQQASTYTLTRRGTDSLEYYNDGRLAKVTHQWGYTVYNYGGFNSIHAKTYENGLLVHEDKYGIDINTNAVYEHESIGYTNAPTGAIVTTNVYKFTYDGQGRMIKKYKKNTPNDRQDFTYDAAGNLKDIKWYNSSNQLVFTYMYSYSNAVPKNKLKLNVEYQGIDLFLNIFGKVSKDMPEHQSCRLASTNELISSEWMTYTVNSDGYPTLFTRFDFIQNKMKPSVAFLYKPVRKM